MNLIFIRNSKKQLPTATRPFSLSKEAYSEVVYCFFCTLLTTYVLRRPVTIYWVSDVYVCSTYVRSRFFFLQICRLFHWNFLQVNSYAKSDSNFKDLKLTQLTDCNFDMVRCIDYQLNRDYVRIFIPRGLLVMDCLFLLLFSFLNHPTPGG